MSAAGRRWMGLVARCDCTICVRMGVSGSPSVVHHLKFGQGASDRASDFLSIAVCPEHHTGASGIHMLKERGLYLRYKCSELDLLADTIAQVEAMIWGAGVQAMYRAGVV